MKKPMMLLAMLLVPALVAAQVPQPAKALSKFEPLLGNFEGSGTSKSPTGQDLSWKAIATGKKLLNGHLIQEDVRIDIEGAGVVVYRTLYSFDTATERISYFSIGNTGELQSGTPMWSSDGKLVVSMTAVQNGEPVTWLTVYTPNREGFDIRVDNSHAGGNFTNHVRGSFKRADRSFDATDQSITAFLPPAKEMARLKGHVGTWLFDGKMSMLPGAPMTPISGREVNRSILGGHVQFAEMMGDEIEGMPSFEGHFYMAWDPAKRCFQNISFDNFGSTMREKTYALDDERLVAYGHGVYMGQAQAWRSLISKADDGDSFTIVQHRLAGEHEPEVSFEGTMKRERDGDRRESPAGETEREKAK